MRYSYMVVAAIGLLASCGFLVVADSADAGEGPELETVLLLHWVNDTEPSRDLGGHSVRNYFDTTTDFEPVNRSVTSGSKWVEDWYLHPVLAESLTTSNVTLGLWMNASGGQKRAQISLTLLDVADAATDPAGTPVHEVNFGNVPLFATPHFMTFGLDFEAYTFEAGHSIRVLISLTPGTSTFVTIVWDTATADSRVVVRTSDRIAFEAAGVMDHEGTPTTGLDPAAEDKGATLFAVVQDPLGSYDVHQVRATLEGPDGSVIEDNVSMDRGDVPMGASPVEFTLPWDYTDAEPGIYTLTVWAVDMSGISHRDHFQHGTLGPYPVLMTVQFSIGELLEAHVLCIDGGDRPVEGALVSAGSRTPAVPTDEDGRVVLSVFAGTVTFTAHWAGVEVGSNTTLVTEDINESSPVVIRCAIFMVDLRAVDGHLDPLGDAAVQVVPPSGLSEPYPYRTDGEGLVHLGLVPGAPHQVLVHWRGFEVANTTVTPEADGTIDVPCAVHWAYLHVTDADGTALPSVQLVVMDLRTGSVLGFGTTNITGDLALRLPDTTYKLEVYWRNTMVLERVDLVLDGDDLRETLECRVFRATIEVVDGEGSALSSVPVVLEDVGGDIVGTAVTDAKGTVVFQLAEGRYVGTAYLSTTYKWTETDLEESVELEVNASGTWRIEFDEYPPGFTETVQFWIFLIIVALIIMMVVLAIAYLRARESKAPMEPTIEAESEGPEPPYE
jgi:hypothetical protein